MTEPKKRRLLLQVRPQFVSNMAVVESLIAAVVGGFMFTIIGGIFLMILFSVTGLGRVFSGGSPFVIALVIALAGIPPLYFEIKRRSFAKTWFNFYEDYFEFQQFSLFMHRNTGRVRYSDIVDIQERSTFLQNMEDLKTIYVAVPGMQSAMRNGFRGIKIPDVPIRLSLGTRLHDIVDAFVSGRDYMPPAVLNTPASAPVEKQAATSV